MIHNDFQMAIIMVFSGLLSSMYIWSDKLSDIRLSLNDLYMVTLMIFWMFFFMGLLSFNKNYVLYSSLAIIMNLWFIRKQIFINKHQYFTGMIPHHSMAILTSKRLLEKQKNLSQKEKEFVESIIKTQENEIKTMKQFLKNNYNEYFIK